MFVVSIIAGVLLVLALLTGFFSKDSRPVSFILAGLFFLVALIFTLLSSFFSQDVGQSSVLKDWTGQVVGEVSDSGIHGKAPWDDVITFDVRNQRVVFVNPATSTGDNSGGNADGREITVTDMDGVSSNVDVTVRYNLNPSKVEDIYRNFKTEDNLKTTLIFNDIRSVVRSQAGKLHTLALLTDRDTLASAIREDLSARWANEGILVDEVALQQIDPPKSVKDSYSAAQQSQIEVQKAQNDLAATKVSAQQKVVSLTPQVLQNKYLEALKAGTVYVVPSGSTPFITTK